MNASIRLACGLSPGPGGFFRKSSTSLPAENASPAAYQSTTRTPLSAAASLKMPASVVYMAAVRAFFLAGRFNSTDKMQAERTVWISLISSLLVLPFLHVYVAGH